MITAHKDTIKRWDNCPFCKDKIKQGCGFCIDPILSPSDVLEQRWFEHNKKKNTKWKKNPNSNLTQWT